MQTGGGSAGGGGVKFNPEVPDIMMPNYMGLSKSITQPMPDMTYEKMFQGIGETGLMAFQGADMMVKDDIDMSVYSQVDAARKEELDKINNLKDQIKGGKKLDILSYSEEDGVDHSDMPAEITGAERTITGLANAKANGKIPLTYYYQRLDSIASSLRNRYPGYRDYIDSKIAKVTGVNPANATIRASLAELNSMLTGKDVELNRALSLAGNKDTLMIPGGPQQYAKLRVTGDIGSFHKWYNEQKRFEYTIDQLKRARDEEKGSKELRVDKAKEYANTWAAGSAQRYFDTVQSIAGIDMPDKILEIVNKARAGKLQLNDEQFRILGQQILAQKDVYTKEAVNQFIKDGTIKHLGRKEVNQIVADNASLFDDVSKAIFDKDIGMAFSMLNTNKSMIAAETNYLYRHEKAGPLIKRMKAFNDTMPEFASQYFRTVLMHELDENIKPLFHKNSLDIMQQPDLSKGVIHSINQQLDEAKIKKVNIPAFNDATIKLVETAIKPNTPDDVKLNIMLGTFDPQNSLNIDKFNGMDPKSGKIERGGFFMFKRLTSADWAKEIQRIDKIYPNFQIEQKYWNWVAESFQKNAHRELIDLNTIQNIPGTKLGWNTNLHQWEFRDEKGRDLLASPALRSPISSGVGAWRQDESSKSNYSMGLAKDSIIRLNSMLKSVGNMAEASGVDVDTYVLQMMMNLGYDPSEQSLNTFPQHMIRSVVQSRAASEMNKQVPKKFGLQ